MTSLIAWIELRAKTESSTAFSRAAQAAGQYTKPMPDRPPKHSSPSNQHTKAAATFSSRMRPESKRQTMRTRLTLQLNLPPAYPLIKSICFIPFGSGGCENQFLRLWPDIGQQLTLTALLRLPIQERRFPYPRLLDLPIYTRSSSADQRIESAT
jgi:hypothetical protein